MTIRAAALVLLLAAPARAYKIGVSCRDVAWLRPAIAEARRIANRCLREGPALNPDLADRFDDALARTSFRCTDEPIQGGIGYALTRKGRPPRIVVMKSPGGYEPSEYGPAIFHEALHALDEDEALLVTRALHNRGNFPDAVYGCDFACAGALKPGWNRMQMFVYDAWSSSDDGVPQKEARCSNCSSGTDWMMMRKFSWLCANGPYLTEDMKARLPRLELAYCLLYGAFKACGESPCAAATRPFRGASPEPTLQETLGAADEIHKFVAVAEALGRPAAQHAHLVNATELDLLRALQTSGVAAACAADPAAY